MNRFAIDKTEYIFEIKGINKIIIALISDLHNVQAKVVVNKLSEVKPDFIVVNGDILYATDGKKSIYYENNNAAQHLRTAPNAMTFLKATSKICPVLFSTGNHELYFDEQDIYTLAELGIIFLDNSFVRFGNFVFGGLSSPYGILAGTGNAKNRFEHKERWKMIYDNVQTGWLDEFRQQPGVKILLCHHPEFYEMFLKKYKDIDLILAGHAHGGQIRMFGRGFYAYGQGLFPKYTKGIYDGKLVVSAGLANTSRFPRINNPPEIVFVALQPK